jgi:hypothetical protein
MGLFKDYTGQRFNRWVALRFSHRDPSKKQTYWWFRCDCGSERVVDAEPVIYGQSKSCGCLYRETRHTIGRPFRDFSGYTSEFLSVLRRGPSGRKASRWYCWCRGCNREVLMLATSLANRAKSCGCQIPEITRKRSTKHGGASRGGHERLYDCWHGMRARCTNSNTESWADYGDRGIRVCERWTNDYAAFREDMGERPARGMSLDRIDVDGHYSCGKCDECRSNGWPLNLRWATKRQQATNKRSTVQVTYNGVRKPLAEWAVELGLDYSLLRNRLFVLGWSVERAFTTPAPPPPQPAPFVFPF